MQGLVDTHTHLESFAKKGELEACLKRAKDAGISRMTTIGTSLEDWSLYRDIAREYPDQVAYTVGLHPCSVGEGWEREIEGMAQFWENTPLLPLAVGEIGLDRFHLPKDNEEEAARIFDFQQSAFAAGLQFAKQLGCPVVIHSRGAFQECVKMIDESSVDWNRVVFHCFAEGPEEMKLINERGGRGSFTGILTYKSADIVREAALAQGLDKLMLETDAPYLTPVPNRGKPNEPAYMKFTAEYAAKLFGVSLEELTNATAKETRRFFGIR